MSNNISDWLEQLGLGQYTKKFTENEITQDLLPDLDHEILTAIGITIAGHRMRIIKAVQPMKSTAPDCLSLSGSVEAPTNNPQSENLSTTSQAERRQLTVMFCDLVGSTALSESVDPEVYRDILSDYRSTTSAEIKRYDGYIGNYMGDGLLVYFGYPQAHEDDAERAVRAGLAIVDAVGKLSSIDKNPLQVRIGIATGLVVAGDIVSQGASEERAVLGDTPNLAARLQGIAEPNTVIVAESTRRLLNEQFNLGALGNQHLKGIAEPVPSFRVEGIRAAKTRFAAVHSAGSGLMIGREQELSLLLERWHSSVAGEGQMVVISGEAGIGKSRIAQAMNDALASDHFNSIMYQCSPYHTDTVLYPVIQQLSLAAGFDVDDSQENNLDKLEKLLRRGQDDVSKSVPFLAWLLGLGDVVQERYGSLEFSPQQRRTRTLDVLLNQLTGLSKQIPLLVVLEDAHWIDPTTLELVELTLGHLASHRIMVLVTARPTFNHDFGGHSVVSRLALNRLGREQVGGIVQRVTKGQALPPELMDEIASKTDGIPLYVEELTKTVLESGLLRETENAFILVEPLRNIDIPSSLHDSLMARLDHVPGGKEIAQMAACIGRNFSIPLLQEIANLPEREFHQGLENLIGAGLIFRGGTQPNEVYVFKHALVQDAAYNSLLLSRRRLLHEKIAHELEKQLPTIAQNEPELIAHHLSSAGRSARAIEFWQAAASASIERSAYREAVSFIERALTDLNGLADNDDKSRNAIDLRLQLRSALGALGEYDAILVRLLEAQEYAAAIEDRHRLAQIKADQIHVLYQMGKVRRAIEVGGSAIELAAGLRNNRILIQASFNVGQAYFILGEARRAVDTVLDFTDELKGSLRHERLGTTGTSTCIWFGNLAEAYARLGEFNTAITYGEEAVRIANETSRPFDICIANLGLIMALVTKGEIKRAIDLCDWVMPLARENELRFALAWSGYLGVVKAYELSNKLDEASIVLEESAKWARDLKLHVAHSMSSLDLCSACIRKGKLSESIDHGQSALDIARTHGYGWNELVAMRLLSIAYGRLDSTHFDQAERHIHDALVLAKELEARPEQAHVYRAYGDLFFAAGDTANARTQYDLADELYRDMEMRFWLEQQQ